MYPDWIAHLETDAADAYADRLGAIEYIDDQNSPPAPAWNMPFLMSLRRHPVIL